MATVAILYVATLIGASRLLRRGAPLRDLAPASLLALTQALWFAVPALAFDAQAGRIQNLAFAAIWVSTAHSAQYLWVTAYYARRSQPDSSTGAFLARALLAGSLLTVLPGLIFAPDLLGRLPWDAGLALLVFAVVNLHHFVLDGAIWKLRDGRVARVLLRSDGPARDEASYAPAPSSSRLRGAWWMSGAVCLLVPFLEIHETVFGINRAGDDPARIETAAMRLKWIGRDTSRVQSAIGRGYAIQGNHRAAVAHYRRSIDLFPTARAWSALGDLYRAGGEWDESRRAYAAALEIESDAARALGGRGSLLLRLAEREPDRVEEARLRSDAVDSLERAFALRPGRASTARDLARAYADSGRHADAIAVLERSLENAPFQARASLRGALAAVRRAGTEPLDTPEDGR